MSFIESDFLDYDTNPTAGMSFSGGGGGSSFGSGITAGGALKGLGGLFGAIGDFSEAGSYNTAAKEAERNAQLTTLSGKIKQFQVQRQVNMVGGAQAAGYSGGNLAVSGSALDVMRSTVQQGAIEHGIIGMQTGQQVVGYEEQAQQFKKMAQAADIAGIGGLISGAASLFGF